MLKGAAKGAAKSAAIGAVTGQAADENSKVLPSSGNSLSLAVVIGAALFLFYP
jgi:hypothetical protein